MNKTDDRLMELAREKLAEAEVEVIRKLIDERDHLKTICDGLKTSNEIHSVEFTALKAQYDNLEMQRVKFHDVISREASVEEREKRIEIMSLKIEHANEKAILTLRLFDTVFQNTIVRKNVQGHVPLKEKYASGDEYISQAQHDSVETVTEENDGVV